MNRKERRRQAKLQKATFTVELFPTQAQERALREMMGDSDTIRLGPREIEMIADAEDLEAQITKAALNSEEKKAFNASMAKGDKVTSVWHDMGVPREFRWINSAEEVLSVFRACPPELRRKLSPNEYLLINDETGEIGLLTFSKDRSEAHLDVFSPDHDWRWVWRNQLGRPEAPAFRQG